MLYVFHTITQIEVTTSHPVRTRNTLFSAAPSVHIERSMLCIYEI